MRINKFIASSVGISRRNADKLIREGRISVNGKTIYDFFDINPDKDIVELDGKQINLQKEQYYFAFYKPPFVLSANTDNSGKAVVCDYFKEISGKLICVGRLDYLSEGLLIVTSDGDFANKIMHPRFKIRKTYLIKTKEPLNEQTIRKLSKGANLEDGFFKPVSVKHTKDPLWTVVAIDSGKNRILRRLFKYFDIPISKLKRIAIGNMELGDLQPGQYRKINKRELENFFINTRNY